MKRMAKMHTKKCINNHINNIGIKILLLVVLIKGQSIIIVLIKLISPSLV